MLVKNRMGRSKRSYKGKWLDMFYQWDTLQEAREIERPTQTAVQWPRAGQMTTNGVLSEIRKSTSWKGEQLSDKGRRAEEILEQLVSNPLLVDFVHLRPKYKRGRNIVELCDLLIEDEPNAVLLELKVQDREIAKPERNEQRWANNQILKASRQITGAINALPKYEIICSNRARGPTLFGKGSLVPLHGVIVVDVSDEPWTINSALPKHSKHGTPLHYFSHDDFVWLCENLIALPDFFDYLAERSKIPSEAIPLLNDEKNAYAYYLTHRRKFGAVWKTSDFNEQLHLLLTEHGDKYREKLKEDEVTGVFKEILETIHRRHPNPKELIPPYLSRDVAEVTQPVLIARHLNRLSSLERRYISKKLIEKIRKTDHNPLGFSYFAYKPEESRAKSTAYVFMASKHERKERIEDLLTISTCVLDCTECKLIVGVVTESAEIGKLVGRSFDYLMMDETLRSTDPRDVEDSKQLFEQIEYVRIYDFPTEGDIRD
ncbi:MAG: hypothetical protein A4E65_02486 [Syntrophorhabdus sp. PtaU1.Bin153]|nr:MAG: hypothetical protein A4E65_02486 [Syntrophorhabdus sp. PtaU1.Bin153]